jgi:glycosyltransferase involved in cell wall biosynthesis
LSIALLEAMSYGLSVLVSDIPANKEVELPAQRDFKCGNVKDLGGKIESLIKQRMTAHEKAALRTRIAADYDWRQIAGQTVAVYEKALGGSMDGSCP